MKDITKDGQRFVFEGTVPGASGTLLRFSSRCAICDKRIEFDAKSFGRAASTPIRRCARHKVPGAAVGSKAEAIAIASHGWRVAPGSLVDQLRRAGKTWKATVSVEAPDGRTTGTRKEVRVERPTGNAWLMLSEIAKRGPCSAVAAADGSEMSDEYARVVAGRLLVKGLLRRTEHGMYAATDKGRETLSDPRLPKSGTASAEAGRPVIGLFD